MNKSDYKLRRQSPTAFSELIRLYLKNSPLRDQFNSHLVFSAWDSASGAGPCTVKKFFRSGSGSLYVTVSSSVVRSQLLFQKTALIERMNAILSANEFFCGREGEKYVKNLIIK